MIFYQFTSRCIFIIFEFVFFCDNISGLFSYQEQDLVIKIAKMKMKVMIAKELLMVMVNMYW